ncbi:hypothetical protein DRQ11_04355, partial [candidate division KSB1 bacterium]
MKKAVLIVGFLMGLVPLSFAQVTVTVPNTSANHGESITIPINVSDLTGLGVISYQFTLTFDEGVLDVTEASIEGTLTSTPSWSYYANTNVNGQITVGGWGTSELSGSGTLIKLNFNVVGAPGETTTLNFSSFIFNAGDPSANTSGAIFTVNSVTVMVTTNIGSGTTVTVDGNTYPAPHTFHWAPGSSHTIGVTSPQPGGAGVQYVYSHWSNGGAQTHAVSPSSNMTYTAYLTTQYYLTIDSPYGTTQGEGWHDAGSVVNFSVTPTTVSGGEGTRYVFTSWSGTGWGAYSGSNNPAQVTMDGPITETANWTTQYFLTTSVNPSDGGTISPSPPGDWYASGSSASISATANSGYVFAGWSGDLSGTTNPTSILMDGPKSVTANFGRLVEVTVTTNPLGLSITVDGTNYTSPQVFNWVSGSTHTIGVSSPQSGGEGVQYVFSSWSDGGAQSHEITVPSSSTTYTANFTTQYYLTVISPYGDPQGEGWYDAGTTATFSISPTTVSGGTGVRYVFSSWTGTGSGSYSGTSPSYSVVMNNPITEMANWETEYLLSTSVNPSAGGTISLSPPGDWYPSGTSVSVSATANSGYVFTGWSGDLSGTANPASITMDGPKNITANFGLLVDVTITTDPSGLTVTVDGTDYTSPHTFTWIAGSTHDIGVPSTQSAGIGVRYVFSSWSDGGARDHEITIPSSPVTYTANFTTQYYLTVISPHGNPQGEGWYDAGSTATFSVTSPVGEGTGVRYVFSGWTGSGSGSYTGSDNPGHVTMNGPITETANWTTQYYLTVNSVRGDPQGEGWYNAG